MDGIHVGLNLLVVMDFLCEFFLRLLPLCLIYSTQEHPRDVRHRIVAIEPALRPANHTSMGVFCDPFCETPLGLCMYCRGRAADWLLSHNECPQLRCVTPGLVLNRPDFNHKRLVL